MTLRYPIGVTGQALVLPDHVMRHLERYRQTRWFSCEAGGQLFSRLEGGDVVVDRITRASDWRTRTSYRPNRVAERREIRDQFRQGLHFVGDWHSHPEARPIPSRTDLLSIAECVRQSVHDLNGFVLIIVDLALWPEGLHVSVHDGTTMAVLKDGDGVDILRKGMPTVPKPLERSCRVMNRNCQAAVGLVRVARLSLSKLLVSHAWLLALWTLRHHIGFLASAR